MNTPTQIGPYRVKSLAASEGATSYYLATPDSGFTEAVVLRTMPLSAFESDDERMELERHVDLYSTLSHSALVQVYERLIHDGAFVVVVEYAEGISLQDFLDALKALEIKVSDAGALYIGLRLFGALAAAHSARDAKDLSLFPVIHGEVRPENVLVPWDGYVRLAEFRGARIAPVWRSRAELGPNHHAAPEQLREARVTGATDIYSAALVLWELLVGRKAIPAALTGAQLRHALTSPQIPKLSSVRSDLPRKLADCIDRCLSPKSADRSETAAQVLSTIRASFSPEDGEKWMRDTLEQVKAGPTLPHQREAVQRAKSPVAPAVAPVPESKAAKSRHIGLVGWSSPEATQTGVAAIPRPGAPAASKAGAPPPVPPSSQSKLEPATPHLPPKPRGASTKLGLGDSPRVAIGMIKPRPSMDFRRPIPREDPATPSDADSTSKVNALSAEDDDETLNTEASVLAQEVTRRANEVVEPAPTLRGIPDAANLPPKLSTQDPITEVTERANGQPRSNPPPRSNTSPSFPAPPAAISAPSPGAFAPTPHAPPVMPMSVTAQMGGPPPLSPVPPAPTGPLHTSPPLSLFQTAPPGGPQGVAAAQEAGNDSQRSLKGTLIMGGNPAKGGPPPVPSAVANQGPPPIPAVHHDAAGVSVVTSPSIRPIPHMAGSANKPSWGLRIGVALAVAFPVVGGFLLYQQVVQKRGANIVVLTPKSNRTVVSTQATSPATTAGVPAVATQERTLGVVPSEIAKGTASAIVTPPSAKALAVPPASVSPVSSASASVASAKTAAPVVPTSPVATASAKVAPQPTAKPPFDPDTGDVPKDKAVVSTKDASAGHRVWIDGKVVGETPSSFTVSCGSHEIRVGSHQAPRTLVLACGTKTSVR